MVRYSILILVFIAALSQVGVQTASLFAVLGAAGIAIGLALQGTLSNIAAGLTLLWPRPFRVGDFIEVNGMVGTVGEIGLFVCHLETFDGIFLDTLHPQQVVRVIPPDSDPSRLLSPAQLYIH